MLYVSTIYGTVPVQCIESIFRYSSVSLTLKPYVCMQVPGSNHSPFDRVSSAGSQPRGRQARARRAELGAQGSLDTEGLFDLEGMEEAGHDLEHFHSEDETDDTDGKSLSHLWGLFFLL